MIVEQSKVVKFFHCPFCNKDHGKEVRADIVEKLEKTVSMRLGKKELLPMICSGCEKIV
jgi:transcription elongation factor Elf1